VYGRAPRGQRLYADVPGKRSKRISVIAAYNQKLLQAPFYFEGYTDTAVFIIWLEQCLIPTLIPGQVVIIDNASFHRSPTIREKIEAVDCHLLYLPPYSPDLNPIEHQWALLKHQFRSQLSSALPFVDQLNHHLWALSKP